ncbi:vitamin B6 photo-protection and homoeostasis-domain-containing protein [Trametes elegans]|nr:vitamin B6 photo-protection and homoeostasis-domain-containing protein [Trametes elegans]
MLSYAISEKDGSGRVIATYSSGGSISDSTGIRSEKVSSRGGWRRVLSNVFLPEGYPATIWNALQAFCSSLAGLFASRAVLQGKTAHGVGNASASATNAIFLSVLQDVYSRLTTVLAAYYFGTSLYPEAKTYRLLADVLNDGAIICDTLSPHLAHFAFSTEYPFFVPVTDSCLRIVALCMSGALRALCGSVAGGSKAALTVHFATAGERPGDVGDLSAKDGSKETVLALLGMLCGSVVLHYVHSARTTYMVLFSLIFCHLAANVVAVRLIAMRVFNRQRASIAWSAYRTSFEAEGGMKSKPAVPNHLAVAREEHIFTDAASIPSPRQCRAGVCQCVLGAPFSQISSSTSTPSGVWRIFSTRTPSPRLNDEQVSALLKVFSDEKYILWFTSDADHSPSLAVVLKDGHGPLDHLKAWAHAHELAHACAGRTPKTFDAQLGVVSTSLERVSRMFSGFVDMARAAGWKTEEGALVGGSPVTVTVELAEKRLENKKDI